jgi:hypothetical protein
LNSLQKIPTPCQYLYKVETIKDSVAERSFAKKDKISFQQMVLAIE